MYEKEEKLFFRKTKETKIYTFVDWATERSDETSSSRIYLQVLLLVTFGQSDGYTKADLYCLLEKQKKIRKCENHTW